MKRLLLAIALLFIAHGASAQGIDSVKREIARATLIAREDGIVAGKPFHMAVVIEAPSDWHTYWKIPGDAGLATTMTWKLPEGFRAGEIEWPPHEVIMEGALSTNGYHGTVVLPTTITPPANLTVGDYHPMNVHVEWLVCKDICLPESAELELAVRVVEPEKLSDSRDAKLFPERKPEAAKPVETVAAPKAADTGFLAALLLALLGGVILNLMPCVLPVLSLKALALIKKSGGEAVSVRNQGIFYTLGVLVSFAAIAAVLIALQQGGQAVGWGFQMQNPAFVGFLIFLLFLVGLNLSGLFHLPVLLGGVGQELANESSLRGSFFTGVLATAVATPCTAPFMASAVGVALTLAPWQAMLIFLSLGFGLALPFLLICLCPRLLRFLPKPGAWMERFKQLLGFSMYGSIIWLLWVLTLQVGAGGMVEILSGMLAILLIIWLKAFFTRSRYHVVGTLLMFAVIGAALASLSSREVQDMPMPLAGNVDAEAYSAARLAELQAQGKTVLVDATAAWCLTCQVNARTSLHNERVVEAFREKGAVLMVADWTRRNPEITEFLKGFGYNGVPLYVVYKPGAEPKVLPQILSPDIVIEAIR